MSDPAVKRTRTNRDWWIPWSFVAFFAVIIAVNGVMLTFALSSFNGLWVEGAYDRGLSYNETLAERQAQLALGWQVDVVAVETGTDRSHLSLTILDDEGNPVRVDAIEAIARRPIAEDLDFDLSFRHTGRGLYEADVDWPQPGQWEIRLTVASGNDSYRQHKRLYVR